MLADARDGLITARQSKSGLQMNSHARVPDSIMRRFGGFAESGVSPDVPKVGNLLGSVGMHGDTRYRGCSLRH
jgi:hypothetical protein